MQDSATSFRARVFSLVCFFFLAACSGGGAGDGGLDGSDGADGSTDGGGDENWLPSDLDPGNGFGLLVPAATAICSYSSESDVLQAYRNAARITLKSDFIKFSRELDRLQYDLIEKIEFGPQRLLATPESAGAFSRKLEGTAQNGTYSYTFEQRFNVADRKFSVIFQFDFKVQSGAALQPIIYLNTPALSVDPWNAESPFLLRALVEDPQSSYDRELRFAACDLSRLQRVQLDIDLAGGDRVQMVVRCPDHSQTFIILSTVCPCLLESAFFERATDRREASDFFRLAFVSWNHCNLAQEMLAVFDQPLGGIFAVRVPGGPDSEKMGTKPQELFCLNEDLSVAETKTITSWQVH